MRKLRYFGIVLLATILYVPAKTSPSAPLRFEVNIAPGLVSNAQNGRLFVVMSLKGQAEPRLTIGQTGLDASPLFGRDVNGFAPGVSGIIDDTCAAFPIDRLSRLEPGEYFVQALFDSNTDLKSVNAPGNLYSKPQTIHLDPKQGATVKIELTERVPAEQTPTENEYVKYVKIQSTLLSKFHGRPIYLRAGVILPKGFENEASRRYPLRVQIGGYGSRFTGVQRMMREGSSFRSIWLADQTPRMVLVHLDGDGPYGDCYQVNSDNNGPYGDAITQELIPFVEQKFRCIGQPWARFLTGGSTGGWVSLALQVFYPDFFNGTWSGFPDGVDFRAFQLINIYEDQNAYVNRNGFERPSARELNGDVRFTIRHECQMENAMGLGDSYVMSGEQWGAWNATYGSRGADGRPAPLWDPKTGKINRDFVDHWKRYDLRMVLEQNWKTLGPKLRGKLTIWVGEADEYFLNNAVHMLDAFLSNAEPPYEGKIVYGPGKGHGWMAFSELELMDQMAAAIERGRK
ncbi:MAG TPA: alpha/beta hydrolase-fold protein [Blastocatellia bacterium]|nr:alpha/beta hydrolase-fold protein [Blastocatellia bacterium]